MVASAFEGIRILELSTGITGSYAAMFLGDLGAEVIKVEGPNGDPWRGTPGFLAWNRGKKSLKIDFERTEAREVIEKLVAVADVLFIDFDSPLAGALYLQYERIQALNPGLIYCSVSPWGEIGPRKQKPGSEGLVAAFACLMGTQPGFTEGPVFLVMPFCSYMAAFIGAFGVANALLVRSRTGMGQKVEVSLLQSVLYGLASGTIWSEGLSRFLEELNTPYGLNPLIRIYPTKDGWIQIACGNPTFWGKLCIVMEKEELVSDPRFQNAPWALIDPTSRAAVTDIVGRWVQERTTQEALALLEKGDVPCSPVRTVQDATSHPQVMHSEMIVEVNDPTVGKLKQMGIPVVMFDTPGKIRGPAPLLGQHSQEVLTELSYSTTQVADLAARGVV